MECCHELTSWYGVLEKFIALIFLLIFDMSLGSIPILSTIWSSLRKEHGNHGHIKLSTLWDSCQLQLHRESWFYSIFIYYEVAHGTVWIFQCLFLFLFWWGGEVVKNYIPLKLLSIWVFLVVIECPLRYDFIWTQHISLSIDTEFAFSMYVLNFLWVDIINYYIRSPASFFNFSSFKPIWTKQVFLLSGLAPLLQ